MSDSPISILISSILDDIGDVDYFIGGSVRFGYATPESDTDIFILAKTDAALEVLIQKLSLPKKNRVRDNFGQVGKGYPFVRFERIFLDCKVDILVAGPSRHSEFRDLKEDHQKVEALINQYPILREFCKILGSTIDLGEGWLSGAHKFRTLLQMAKKKNGTN